MNAVIVPFPRVTRSCSDLAGGATGPPAPDTASCDSYVDASGGTLCSDGLLPISGGEDIPCSDVTCDDAACCFDGKRKGDGHFLR